MIIRDKDKIYERHKQRVSEIKPTSYLKTLQMKVVKLVYNNLFLLRHNRRQQVHFEVIALRPNDKKAAVANR